MKIFIFSLALFVFASCKCKKNTTNLENSKMAQAINVIKSNCPENGTCTTEIFRNQSLDIKTDDFGSIYYNKIDNLETSIISYNYNRNVPKGLQDGSYREEIVFEIDNKTQELNLKNDDLQKVKMLFGRFCFCKGSTGNYKVIDGTLNLVQKNNEIKFDLEFKNNKVPQLILQIAETVK